MARKALYDYSMLSSIDDQGKIAVALSGGKDSLTLLFMLHAISGRGFPKFDIVAIHVGGEFSCGAGVNADYLRSICTALDVEFVECNSTQKLETLECYRCSRERRRLIFESAKERGAKTVAFGHHRDDNAQTVLMNLLHKAEFAGNLPKLEMVEFGVTIIRPLIFVSEDEIREFAKNHGFARVMCQCPVGQHSLRRKTQGLLAEMEEIFPNATANLAQAALQYGSDKASRP